MQNKLPILLLTALLPLPAQAQYEFNFVVSSIEASPALVVSGSIDFFINPGFIDVELFNEPGTSSYVSGIYFLKPSSLMNIPALAEAPADWVLATEFDVGVASGPIGKLGSMSSTDAFDHYFGAVTGPKNPALASDQQAFFSWEADAAFGDDWLLTPQNWLSYFGSENPHVIIRWQSVGDRNGEDSDRGYAFIPFTITPVPEPSQIAALSILGLGAVLLIRRRITRRKSQI